MTATKKIDWSRVEKVIERMDSRDRDTRIAAELDYYELTNGEIKMDLRGALKVAIEELERWLTYPPTNKKAARVLRAWLKETEEAN